ncbi:MAG: aromatic ring-hydroxylating oxygenase subunit alpha [Actinomycetota bacterium]
MSGDRAPLPIDGNALAASMEPPGRTLPALAYAAPQVFDWEREHLFEASWYCLGRSADLPRPGDRRAVRVGTDAVLLVRGADRELRGFFNTCRHRGHELVSCGGSVEGGRYIRCPYHSWTYDLDGSFRGAPAFRHRREWSRDDPDNALVPARVGEWAGWVFADCSGQAPPLRQHVGNLDEALRPYETARLAVAASDRYTVAANWKLVSENYHECYHCSTIHPELCRVTPPDSGTAFAPTGLVIGGTMDLMDHAETMSLTGRSGGQPLRGLDPSRLRQVLYVQVFPNLLVSAHPDYVLTHRLEPVGAGRTVIECQWLFPPEVAGGDGFDPSYAVEFWDLTNRQDWAASEGVQRGVRGRGYRQGPLSEAEGNVWQFVSVVAQSYLHGRLTGPVPRWQPVSS